MNDLFRLVEMNIDAPRLRCVTFPLTAKVPACNLLGMDIGEPQFTTPELLSAVPRLTNVLFKQWILREHVELSSAETSVSGRPTLHTAADIIQVAFVRKLAAQGISPGLASAIWKSVGYMLNDWRGDGPKRDRLLFLHFEHPGDFVHFIAPEKTFTVVDLANAARKQELPDFDWTDFQFMVRFDHFVAAMLSRLQTVIDIREGKYSPPRGRKTSPNG